MRQRGFSLIEVTIAAAIVITIAAVVLGVSSNARPYALRSAATQFDAALAYGRAIAASSGNGATLVFAPREAGGFSIAIYAGRPTAQGALHPSGIPPMVSDARVDVEGIGGPPFALFLSGAGNATLAASVLPTPAPGGSEPACPSSGTWKLTLAGGPAKSEVWLPCFAAVSGP